MNRTTTATMIEPIHQGCVVSEQKVDVEGGKITAFRVTLRISFVVE